MTSMFIEGLPLLKCRLIVSFKILIWTEHWHFVKINEGLLFCFRILLSVLCKVIYAYCFKTCQRWDITKIQASFKNWTTWCKSNLPAVKKMKNLIQTSETNLQEISLINFLEKLQKMVCHDKSAWGIISWFSLE